MGSRIVNLSRDNSDNNDNIKHSVGVKIIEINEDSPHTVEVAGSNPAPPNKVKDPCPEDQALVCP